MKLQKSHSNPVTFGVFWEDFVAISSLAALGAIVVLLIAGQ